MSREDELFEGFAQNHPKGVTKLIQRMCNSSGSSGEFSFFKMEKIRKNGIFCQIFACYAEKKKENQKFGHFLTFFFRKRKTLKK